MQTVPLGSWMLTELGSPDLGQQGIPLSQGSSRKDSVNDGKGWNV